MRDADALRGLHLHLDCASGAAGDMTLGALIDLGVPESVIRDALDAVGVGGHRLRARRVVKGGISAVDVTVDTRLDMPDGGPVGDSDGHAHGHDHHDPTHVHDHHDHAHDHHDHAHDHHDHTHDHHHHAYDHHDRAHEHDAHAHDHHDHAHGHDHAHAHAHHPYREIAARIRGAALDPATRERALDMFERVARAEARLHGTTPDDVAFHEVGAIDSIVDIVGTAAALAHLAPASVTAVSVAMGHGTVRCAHGVLPVPSPAAIEILREAGGVSVSGAVARELCTPTGAAILAATVTAWAPMPPVVPVAIGYGAGDAELPDRPNVLRVIAGRPAGAAAEPAVPVDDRVYRVEANIDDVSPELCDHAAAAAFAAGALDVWWTPVHMKKSRPGLVVGALAPPDAVDAVTRALLRETSTIGVRLDLVARRVLDRDIVEVDTPHGRVAVKVSRLAGEVVNAAPEYESCRTAADARGVPLKRVYAAAVAAYERAARDDA